MKRRNLYENERNAPSVVSLSVCVCVCVLYSRAEKCYSCWQEEQENKQKKKKKR